MTLRIWPCISRLARNCIGLWLADSVGSPFNHVEVAFAIEVVDHESKAFGSTPVSNGLVPCSFQEWSRLRDGPAFPVVS